MADDALHRMRHSCAHVMAAAVQTLFPGTKFGVGPAISNGFFYDVLTPEPLTEADLGRIEDEMRRIVKKRLKLERREVDVDEALELMRAGKQDFKVELLDLLKSKGSTAVAAETGDEDAVADGVDTVSFYTIAGFTDLCRGPHVDHTGQVGAFKLRSIAGAYWRGDQRNPQMQRLYGLCFATDEDLKQEIWRQEEAAKRDHRKLGREMDLFHFQEEAPGAVFWHAKGWTLFQTLIGYMRTRFKRARYQEVDAPQLMDRALWEASGHWANYKKNMFTTEIVDEERTFALKPMNCPGHCQIFKQGIKSYRDLPVRIAEFGRVHRFEASGALHGLLRVRAFTQDDSHIFITEAQLAEVAKQICEFILSIYRDFGFTDIAIKLSDRPAERIGTDEAWDYAENSLKAALDAAGLPWTLNPGEGAFYGPKLEFVLRDALGRDWQCGTLQVDPNLPSRLGVSYVGQDGTKQIPIMLHQANFGSLERFTGILIEHYAGAFPTWLAPLQVMVVPIADRHLDYAYDVADRLAAADIRVEVDASAERMQKKIRNAQMQKVPYMLVVGDKEAEQGMAAVRLRSGKDLGAIVIDDVIERITQEVRTRQDIVVAEPADATAEAAA
ncbi:MAG: threonine--tRNA ligase [Alphaproteobacteria bacterium]|nr:threonine--tRNA ligase [Alphaproteobacteria bacterium]